MSLVLEIGSGAPLTGKDSAVNDSLPERRPKRAEFDDALEDDDTASGDVPVEETGAVDVELAGVELTPPAGPLELEPPSGGSVTGETNGTGRNSSVSETAEDSAVDAVAGVDVEFEGAADAVDAGRVCCRSNKSGTLAISMPSVWAEL